MCLSPSECSIGVVMILNTVIKDRDRAPGGSRALAWSGKTLHEEELTSALGPASPLTMRPLTGLSHLQ